MWWLIWALLAHGGNALVFVIDKSILGTHSSLGAPARYAAYTGLLSAMAAILLLFVPVVPTMFLAGWALLAGVFWIIALWQFFWALKLDEPSRVVPVTGAMVGLCTALFASLFLGESLSGRQLSGVGALVLGGVLLSVRMSGVRLFSSRALLGVVCAGSLFAAHFVIMDFLYDQTQPFLAVFAYGRIGVGVAALALLCMLPRRLTRSRAGFVSPISLGFVTSKGIATAALLMQNYAISLGSAAVVTALQGTQYVFVLLLGVAVSAWYPQLFREEVRLVALAQKIFGIGLVGVGVWLVAT